MLPFLCGLAFIYFVHSSTAQLVLNVKLNNGLMVSSVWFLRFLSIECWMGFVLVAWAGPGMITKDLANNSVQLYLSRPLSRTEYLFGKVSVLGALLSGTILIPAILLFFLQAQLERAQPHRTDCLFHFSGCCSPGMPGPVHGRM